MSYLRQDTIAAVASGLGGAIAIVRMSGPDTLSALRSLVGAQALDRLEERKAAHLSLKSRAGGLLDDAVVILYKNPRSYTGEDSAELQIHGNALIAHGILEELGHLGVRQALPGEFSFRAVRNGKLSLDQARALPDLIAAPNSKAVSVALERITGGQLEAVRAFAEDLRKLAMLGEVGIDFSDQDVDEVSLDNLKKKALSTLSTLKELYKSYQRGVRIFDGITAAFIGLPNAGKSSLFNAILGEERSIVSHVAGTTRDIVSEQITLKTEKDTATFRLLDTAGLRTTGDLIEKEGVNRTEKSAAQADLLILIVDPNQPRDELKELWERISRPGTKTLGVLTKIDLNKQSEYSNLIEQFQEFGINKWCLTSSRTGVGIHDLIEAMLDRAHQLTDHTPGEWILTRVDQLQAVEIGIENLERSLQAKEIDLFASDVRHALHALAPLIGETTTEDILGKIFSEFCIGK